MYKKLIFYETKSGKIPFKVLMSKIKDIKGKAKIETRLNRLIIGNYGDYKHLKEQVYELRINYGPGYRVYFAELSNKRFILLLFVGRKQDQNKDIQKALKYWKTFKERFDDA